MEQFRIDHREIPWASTNFEKKLQFEIENPVSINHFAALHNPHSRDILQMTIMHPVLILNYDPDNISPCSFFFMQVVHGQDSATSKRWSAANSKLPQNMKSGGKRWSFITLDFFRLLNKTNLTSTCVKYYLTSFFHFSDPILSALLILCSVSKI